MIRKIITYPNPNLFKKSLAVESFDDELGALLDDMYDTMIASNHSIIHIIKQGSKLVIKAFYR